MLYFKSTNILTWFFNVFSYLCIFYFAIGLKTSRLDKEQMEPECLSGAAGPELPSCEGFQKAVPQSCSLSETIGLQPMNKAGTVISYQPQGGQVKWNHKLQFVFIWWKQTGLKSRKTEQNVNNLLQEDVWRDSYFNINSFMQEVSS